MNATAVSLNGMDMYCEVRGDGEPLVLLHGFTGSGSDWSRLFDLDRLARHHRLIVPDLRGHGRSTNPAQTFTHRQSALDVLALLDHLRVGRFQAMGLSAGAKTLLHVATGQPDRLSALVLVSGTMYFPEQARKIMRAFTAESRSEEEWQAMRARHPHGDEQIRALLRQGQAFGDSHDDMTFTPPHLATVKARTFIVHGDRDPFYPVEMAVEMFRAIPGAALWVVPWGGHVPIFSAGVKEEFVRTSLAFLAGNESATPLS
jgi:pimeloyl-ACP methyl ester carboxylesterase